LLPATFAQKNCILSMLAYYTKAGIQVNKLVQCLEVCLPDDNLGPFCPSTASAWSLSINDVLPLKAARRDTITNLKCFGAPEHQRPCVDGFIYIHYAAPSYSACMSAIYLLPFGKVWLGSVFSKCNA